MQPLRLAKLAGCELRHAPDRWDATVPLGATPLALPIPTRHRLILALPAVDGWLDSNSYRKIAQRLSGIPRIPTEAGKHTTRAADHSPDQDGVASLAGRPP